MFEGKLDIVKAEMKHTKLNILGINELIWTGMGYFNSDDYMIYYSGNEFTWKN